MLGVRGYVQMQAYNRQKSLLKITQYCFYFCYEFSMLLLIRQAQLWHWMDEVLKETSVHGGSGYEFDQLFMNMFQAIVFSGALTAGDVFVNMPFEFYSVFFIEDMWDFNLQTPIRWFINKIKKTVLAMVLHSLFYVSFLVWIMEYWKENRLEKMALIITVVYVIVHITFPNMIFPNFNKLEDPSIVNKERRDALMEKIETEVKNSGIAF
jgi:hypothetical protein